VLITAVLVATAACDGAAADPSANATIPPPGSSTGIPAASIEVGPSPTTATDDPVTTSMATTAPPADPPQPSAPLQAPPEGPTTTMPLPTPSDPTPRYQFGDIDPGLHPFIEFAVDDLAGRMGVDPGTITTHAAVLVVWSDASLGCPQPDMRYPQVPVDGSAIELEHGGRYYLYHSGGGRKPFLCVQTARKSPVGTIGLGSLPDS
jgi:hypothetical protein